MSLLRTFLLPLLFLAAGASVQAAEPCPAPPDWQALGGDALRAGGRDRGVLWKLGKDGRTSWLYGTVHVNRVEWFAPGPRTLAALREAQAVALELDPADPELARVFATRGDAQREQRVLAGLQPRIAALAERGCVAPERLGTLRPMLQLMMLGMAEARREGLHAEAGVDALLFRTARRMGKDIVALESPASQLAALVPETEADERVLVEQNLRDLESGEGREQLAALLDVWAEGDAARIATYAEWCDCLRTPAEQRYFRRLNDLRNASMADKLLALHDGGRPFFAAVGALHMSGPQALQVLLRARGFTAEPVSFSSTSTP